MVWTLDNFQFERNLRCLLSKVYIFLDKSCELLFSAHTSKIYMHKLSEHTFTFVVSFSLQILQPFLLI